MMGDELLKLRMVEGLLVRNVVGDDVGNAFGKVEDITEILRMMVG